MLPIFIISLPHQTQRRAHMKAQLDALSLAHMFIDGVDGKTFTGDVAQVYNTKRRLKYFGRLLTPGEVGCLLSHKMVLQKIVDENIPAALVLEDDVILQPDIISVLGGLQKSSSSYDLIRFLAGGKIAKARKRKMAALDETYALYKLLPLSGGAYAYIITRQGARRLLASMPRAAFPIDVLMARAWESGLNALILHPSPIAHDDEFESGIGAARFDKNVRKTIIFKIHRAVFKSHEAAMKYVSYYQGFFGFG